MKHKTVLLAAVLALAGSAHAALSAHNTDAVRPNSPFKEAGMPDAGTFNPAGPDAAPSAVAAPVAAPAARPPHPPASVARQRPPRPYALAASPTLPCAPAYCPSAVRVRADRN
ncbi:MAG: hypothetical protein QM772_06280 [Ottowia sp.]|uniref:hypothetical protein n=1 Tax=Ottowia sp. TaxID=1898956 RepID=UPI0039E3B99F